MFYSEVQLAFIYIWISCPGMTFHLAKALLTGPHKCTGMPQGTNK